MYLSYEKLKTRKEMTARFQRNNDGVKDLMLAHNPYGYKNTYKNINNITNVHFDFLIHLHTQRRVIVVSY